MIPDIDVNLCIHPLDDPQRVDDWLTDVLNSGQPLALDTETYGVDYDQRNVRLLQLGTANSGWAVPAEDYRGLSVHLLHRLRESGARVLMHNSAFDMHALSISGLPLPRWSVVEDTMLLHHLHRSNEFHGLKGIAGRNIGRWAWEGQDQLKALMNRTGTDWGTVPVDAPEYWAYGVMDTVLTRLVWDWLDPTLQQFKDPYGVEMAYRDIMWRAERRGMTVDTGYARNLITGAYTPRIDELYTVLADAGVANPNSNRQVEAALQSLGWEASEWTPTGEARLDRAVLDKITSLGGLTAELATNLVEYKRLVGWRDKYLVKFRDSGGRLHPSVRTMGARTGRSSVTDPPIQQIPGHGGTEIRDCVTAPEGHLLVAIDYAGQEARLFAHYSGDPAMRAELSRDGGDLHQMVADQIGVPRPIAKTINFALIYGAGPAKMAEQAGVSEGEMHTFLAEYHDRFPQVRIFMQEVEATARRREPLPYVTTGGGRRAYANHGEEYKLVNYLVQGTGADVLKQAAARLDAIGLADYIVVPVHDELVFSFPAADAEELTTIAVETMRDDNYAVPLIAEASQPCFRWGECK